MSVCNYPRGELKMSRNNLHYNRCSLRCSWSLLRNNNFKPACSNFKMSQVKVKELAPDTQESLVQLFKGKSDGFCKFGLGEYILPACYKTHADAVIRMQLRPDDIWVVTFPRSGTTWTQEMTWLLKHDLDYETAVKKPLHERYFFLELFAYEDEMWREGREKGIQDFDFECKPKYLSCASAASPRFFKTHLPLSLLPPALLHTCRVMYVARDPRDVAYSFYQLTRMFTNFDYVGDFKTFWEFFQNDLIINTPFFSHVKDAWAQRHHPNMLFIFYEDLNKDLTFSLRRIAKFLGKEYSDVQIQRLCDHLHIENFRINQSVNPSSIYDNPQFTNKGHEGFIRKGKSGGWREHFDAEMTAQAEDWLQQHLSGTDLRFSDHFVDIS